MSAQYVPVLVNNRRPMSPEDECIARLKKVLGRIAAIPRRPGDDGEAQRLAREALRRD